MSSIKTAPTYSWEKLSDKELLELRFCDLELQIEGSRIEPVIESLYQELANKNLNFKPHVWISEDWFAIDGIPGIAVPFYTLHKRLSQLCKKMHLDDEGYNKKDAIKLLRHEAGHAIDNAYKLRLSRQRQKLFGFSKTSYPETYAPKSESSKFVTHLNPWYAQAHPDEDWAETFAIWLNPNSNWRKIYRGTIALEKLEFLNKIMRTIEFKEPLVQKKNQPGDISLSRRKLKTFFIKKSESLNLNHELNLLPMLNFIFSSDSSFKKKKRADVFIKQFKDILSKKIAFWTGHNSFTINMILLEIIKTCHENDMYLVNSEKETRMELMAMLATQTHHSTIFSPIKIMM